MLNHSKESFPRSFEELIKIADADPMSKALDHGETKKYKFKDFDPRTILDLLPGWKIKLREIGPGRYSGWEFSRDLQTKDKAIIGIDVKGKSVSFGITLRSGGQSHAMSLENINQIKLKPKLKELVFEGRNGTYTIKNSIWHHLESKDKRSRVTITSN